MPLEKFKQVPIFSHTKFSHNEWRHLRELWRQVKFCFLSMVVSPKRFSYFLYCEYGNRDWLKYIYDICVFISRLSASVTQSQSRVARKAGHNRSRHRATPAKVSFGILWSLNGKHTESIACLAVWWWARCSLQSNFISTKQKYMKFGEPLFHPHLHKILFKICCVIDNTTYFSNQDINIILFHVK